MLDIMFVFLCPQTPIHKSTLLKRHPPFTGFTGSIGIKTLDQASGELLANLYQILSQVVWKMSLYYSCLQIITKLLTSVNPIPRRCVMCIELESTLSGDRDVVNGKRV